MIMPRASLWGMLVLLWCLDVAVPGVARGQVSAPQVIVEPRHVAPLTLQPVATLRSTADFELFRLAAVVAVLATGEIAVAGDNGTEIGIFGTNGRLLRRVGRRGAGPGEFSRVSQMIRGPGDSIHVYDALLRRLTTFDPGMRQAIASRRVPDFSSIAFLGRETIVSGDYRSPEAIGYSLFRLGQDGALGTPVGPALQAFSATEPLAVLRTLATSRDGGRLYAGHINAYRIDLWTGALSSPRTMVRRVAWFPESTAPLWIRGQPNPHPAISGIGDREDGTLAVTITDRAPSWRPPADRAPRSESQVRVIAAPEYTKAYVTRVEILDPVRGSVVAASVPEPGLLFPLRGSDLLVRIRPDPDEEMVLEILRPAWAFRATRP